MFDKYLFINFTFFILLISFKPGSWPFPATTNFTEVLVCFKNLIAEYKTPRPLYLSIPPIKRLFLIAVSF